MATFNCSSCNFSFKKASESIKVCPFCGKEGTVYQEVCESSLFTNINSFLGEKKEKIK